MGLIHVDRRTLSPKETAEFEVPIEFCRDCQAKIDAKNAFVIASPERRPEGVTAQEFLGALISFRLGNSIGTRYVNTVRVMRLDPSVSSVYLAECLMLSAQASYIDTARRHEAVARDLEKVEAAAAKAVGDLPSDVKPS